MRITRTAANAPGDSIPCPALVSRDTKRGQETHGRPGGAPAWITGSYDPELNLILLGNWQSCAERLRRRSRRDNLYSNCMLALDADTGKLKWHYQFSPHDVHD